ncbi:MAG: cellulase family glycosylhydrolase [Capsulimonadaceae bacterium]|nr:cellulase family glycosylhydrolase [Capsulimonadaceae bacterium]
MNIYRLFAALLAIVGAAIPSTAADLAPLRVDGPNIVANGRPICLRGLNWGWWHLSGTRYTEDDMKRQAQWGANVARLAFSYRDVEAAGQPGVWNEAGFAKIDQVVQWGARYGVYVILDMHETPGGQNGALYDDGGGNRLWSDAACQKRFIALWQEIARRYRNHPEVAAYELLNEPDTIEPTAARLTELSSRTIDAIRLVDPNKIVVVCGDKKSGPLMLNDAMYISKPNLLYTMHFYDGGGDRWLHNLTNGPGISGTQNWTLLTHTFTAPHDATGLHIMFRSADNKGVAWFDDVRLTDASGHILAADGFDTGSGSFQAEHGPRSPMTYDRTVGHDRPGSLRVSGTTSYNGWAGPKITIQPGASYTLSVWVKLEGATGDTYLTAAFIGDYVVPKEQLRPLLQPSIDFSRKHNVPVWVGEFGCEACTLDNGQVNWVSDCIALFDEAKLNWTYWNYRETTNPNSMALQAEHKDGSDFPLNEPLLAVLRNGWALNAAKPR